VWQGTTRAARVRLFGNHAARASIFVLRDCSDTRSDYRRRSWRNVLSVPVGATRLSLVRLPHGEDASGKGDREADVMAERNI
jgi:hypothetical protein